MFSEARELGRGYTTRALEEVVARSWEESRFEKTLWLKYGDQTTKR